MSKNRKKPYLNRKKTQTLLTTFKMVTTTGALSLTLAGWGLLANLDARQVVDQAAANPVVAVADRPATPVVVAAAQPTPTVSKAVTATSKAVTATPKVVTATPKQTIKLNIVQWVQNTAGDPVAVVQDRRGALWYVMGSDVPRLEQGQAPLIQPQLVRISARTRAS